MPFIILLRTFDQYVAVGWLAVSLTIFAAHYYEFFKTYTDARTYNWILGPDTNEKEKIS